MEAFLAVLFLAALAAVSYGQNTTEIDDIRLVNGTFGKHMGRLEVNYNGTWGTVCDDFWSFSDSRVACKMLGFEDTVCAVTRARFGQADPSVPILMSGLQCRGREFSLDRCDFNGWGIHHCTHREDAGLICVNTSVVDQPMNVVLLDSTTKSLTVGWTVGPLPEGAIAYRFRVTYQSADSTMRTRFLFPRGSVNATSYNITITGLQRDTEYTVQVRAEARYRFCFSYLPGSYSDVMRFRTNVTRRESNIPVRLIPPIRDLNFLGRVEVFYNNTWGTVCDDFFSFSAATVVCEQLGFSRAVCSVSRGRMGEGSGKIWLDNVRCTSGEERLDDCSFNDWGDHNCDHGDDVGVICAPDNFPNQVANLTVVGVGSDSITVRWSPVDFPVGTAFNRYLIRYETEDSFFPRTAIASERVNEFTIRRLRFGSTYNITVAAQVRFSYCFSYISSSDSEQVSATTMETAPTAPPTSFHIRVVNSSAIEVLWQLPPFAERNGIIRGYKIFYRTLNGPEQTVNVMSNETIVYIIGGLQPGTLYTVSILAYTVGDGPRSIHLTAGTKNVGDPVCIIGFGVLGDGADKVVRFTFQRDLRIHCTTSRDSDTDWFFSNGSIVGNDDRNIREGHHDNGTTVLQIGSNRRLGYCDAGIYTCVANCSSGVETKNFTLVINSNPPRPSRPTPLEVKSNSITIGWQENECDGGHVLSSFNIDYSDSDDIFFPFPFGGRTTTIRNISPDVRNYTITGLDPETTYNIRVQAVSVDFRTSSYSIALAVTTLPPAPSAPRDVTVRIVTPFIVEVSWKLPATPNGVIIQFTVYAIPLGLQAGRQKRQAEPVSVNAVIKKVFPSTARAGNITLDAFATTYQFQVSASIQDGQNEQPNEGDLSTITPNSTIFIPVPGLPTPQNVRIVRRTNASIIITWDYPPPPAEPIQSFKISYSSSVKWRSPGGDLLQFDESEQTTSDITMIQISALTPGTTYLIKVSAVTQSGQGQEVQVSGTTLDAMESERLAFFQIRFGPITSCLDFQSGNITKQLFDVRTSLVKEINRLCSCGVTVSNIKMEEFSCLSDVLNQIVYRGRIVGTETFSATALLAILDSWIGMDSASITVQSSRLQLDSSCVTTLDTLRDPVCPPPEPTTQSTTQSPVPSERKEVSGVRAGEVGGIIVGVIIAVLLIALIVIVFVVAMAKLNPKRLTRNNGATRHIDEDDKTPFADIGDSGSAFGDPQPEKPISDF